MRLTKTLLKICVNTGLRKLSSYNYKLVQNLDIFTNLLHHSQPFSRTSSIKTYSSEIFSFSREKETRMIKSFRYIKHLQTAKRSLNVDQRQICRYTYCRQKQLKCCFSVLGKALGGVWSPTGDFVVELILRNRVVVELWDFAKEENGYNKQEIMHAVFFFAKTFHSLVTW